MLYEIHMLKNYPPTNLNRDDSGAPKTCVFGGTTRGRISSQCLKRSWRTSELFRNEVGEDNLGIRTRKLPDLVADKLTELGVQPDYVEAVKPKITGFGNKDGKENKEERTSQVIFFAPQDIDAVAAAVKDILSDCKSKKDVEKLKAKDLQSAVKDANIRPVTLDIALFGRMVTSDAFRDVDASMQVAHAISTNKITTESDYFTAMDDLMNGTETSDKGAAMVGDIDFNASCYYIYAAIDTDILMQNLSFTDSADVIIKKTVPALIRAMAFTNPSGKQNSFAGHVLPSAVLVECKNQKVPTSLVNAYVKPVGTADPVEESVKRLADEADMVSRNYGLQVENRFWFSVDKYKINPSCEASICSTFSDLVNAVASTMN